MSNTYIKKESPCLTNKYIDSIKSSIVSDMLSEGFYISKSQLSMKKIETQSYHVVYSKSTKYYIYYNRKMISSFYMSEINDINKPRIIRKTKRDVMTHILRYE